MINLKNLRKMNILKQFNFTKQTQKHLKKLKTPKKFKN